VVTKGLLLAGLVLLGSFSSIFGIAFAADQFFLVTLWGSYGTIDGKFKYPRSVAVDAEGNVYLADTGNNRIQKFASNGAFVTKWGSYGKQDGNFNAPQGIAVDAEGNVYVADTGNSRVQKFSGNGTFVAAWGSYGSDDGQLKRPTDIAVDPSSGDLYLVDTLNNSIHRFSNNGTFIVTLGSYGITDGEFKYPRSVAVDAEGNVYVADTGNNGVQKFSGNGTFIAKWGSYGKQDGNFNAPQGIAVDADGNVYVADTMNNRIQKFTSNGTFTAKEGIWGKAEGTVNQLADVSVDSSGNIFAVDVGNNRILHYIISQTEEYENINIVEGEPFVKDPELRIETVTDELVFPTNMAFLGPNDILSLQKNVPAVYRIVDGNVTEEPLLELDLGGQFIGCMCGIAVEDNADIPYVFLYYYILRPAGENPAGSYLYRYELVDNKMINPELLLFLPTSDRSIHMGGEVIIGPDDNVYLVMGDMDGHKTMAQNFVNGTEPDGTSAILRMTQDGEAVVDENSLGTEDPLNKYYAYGIRNSFGMDFDPVTGNLWDTENGPAYGDEINLVEQGFNSGHRTIQGMSSNLEGFDPDQLVDFDGKGKYSDPEFEWMVPIGVTAIKFLNSDKLGETYENDLFVSDVNNGNIYRFELNENRTELALNGSLADKVADNILEREEAVFASGFTGITDMQTGPDGYLYVVSIVGKIFRIVPDNVEGSTNE
jgi:glucose/arabinose dehydrogenase